MALCYSENREDIIEKTRRLFSLFIDQLHCSPSYIIDGDGGKAGGSKDKNIRRSAMMYYLKVNLQPLCELQTDVYRAIGEVMHRSRTNVLEQCGKFEVNFKNNIDYLGIDDRFVSCSYSVGDIVKVQNWNWYRGHANLILPCGDDIKAMVRCDGSVFYTISNDVTDKIKYCGKNVTITDIGYSKGIPSFVKIKEDGGKNKFQIIEIAA